MSLSEPLLNQRALLVTIGADGENPAVIEALMADITAYRPDLLAIVETDRSRAAAESLERAASDRVRTIEHVRLNTAHDIDEIFGRIRELIGSLLARGFHKNAIAVNYSNGTKVMTSALVLAAVFEDAGQLRYVRSEAGMPLDERLITAPAGAIFANRDIDFAITLGLQTRFAQAGRILAAICPDFLKDEERRLVAELESLVWAYGEWDEFRIGRFLERYETVSFAAPALAPFYLDTAGAEAVRQLADAMAGKRPAAILAVEFFNSAERRRREGAVNDALTRQYRALEILAQERLLLKYGINADDVSAPKTPPRYRPDFEALRSPTDGRIRLGLRKAYELLYRLDDALGQDFQNDDQMPTRLDERRMAVLAHGVTPIDTRSEEDFYQWTRQFLTRHIPDFDDWRHRLQFPWIARELSEKRESAE